MGNATKLMKRKRAEPFGWTQIIDARDRYSLEGNQCVCADVKSVFEIMKKQPQNILTRPTSLEIRQLSSAKRSRICEGVGANAAVVPSSAGRPRAGETCCARQDGSRKSCARRSQSSPTSETKSANRSRLNDERPAAPDGQPSTAASCG